MTTTLRRASAIALALGLIFGTAACSSDSSDGASDEATTTVAPDDGTSATEPGDEPAADPTDCTADKEAGSANLSGSASVLFAADSDSGVTEADITPETTLAVSADAASMEPSTLTVPVGTVFGIAIPDDGSTDAAVVGCAGGQTIPPGVTVGFVIKAAGTYPVSLEIAGTDLGTVTVE